MSNATEHKELKMMSHEELVSCGWRIPSFKQFSANMDKRLKKVRGEDIDNDSFLIRHNYKSNLSRAQA